MDKKIKIIDKVEQSFEENKIQIATDALDSFNNKAQEIILREPLVDSMGNKLREGLYSQYLEIFEKIIEKVVELNFLDFYKYMNNHYLTKQDCNLKDSRKEHTDPFMKKVPKFTSRRNNMSIMNINMYISLTGESILLNNKRYEELLGYLDYFDVKYEDYFSILPPDEIKLENRISYLKFLERKNLLNKIPKDILLKQIAVYNNKNNPIIIKFLKNRQLVSFDELSDNIFEENESFFIFSQDYSDDGINSSNNYTWNPEKKRVKYIESGCDIVSIYFDVDKDKAREILENTIDCYNKILDNESKNYDKEEDQNKLLTELEKKVIELNNFQSVSKKKSKRNKFL